MLMKELLEADKSAKGVDDASINARLDAVLEPIAKKHLDVETLKTRHSDSLDFYDCSVWSIKSALKEAFNAGLRFKK